MTTCCLNLLPPPNHHEPNSISSPNLRAPPLIARQEERRSWRTKCLVSLACTAVGLLGATNLVLGNESYAAVSSIRAAPLERYVEASKAAPPRWSEKRSCPPWETNSLEIVVPENLPRPYARRKWEDVGGSSKAVPTTKAAVIGKRKPGCFSM